jgi:hypothetical protein
VLTVLLGLFPALVLDLIRLPVSEILSVVGGAAEAAVGSTAGLLP